MISSMPFGWSGLWIIKRYINPRTISSQPPSENVNLPPRLPCSPDPLRGTAPPRHQRRSPQPPKPGSAPRLPFLLSLKWLFDNAQQRCSIPLPRETSRTPCLLFLLHGRRHRAVPLVFHLCLSFIRYPTLPPSRKIANRGALAPHLVRQRSTLCKAARNLYPLRFHPPCHLRRRPKCLRMDSNHH